MRFPIEKITNEVTQDGQTIKFLYVVRFFGFPVFVRQYNNKVLGSTNRTSGFDILPNNLVEVEDDDDE